MNHPILTAAKRHRLFALLIALQVLFLLGMTVLSFRSQVKLTFTPDQLIPTGQVGVSWPEETVAQICVEEKRDRCAAFSHPIPLPSGAYDITIQYTSISDLETPSASIYDSAGWVDFSLESNPNALSYNSIQLSDDSQAATGRIWIRMGAGAEDLTLNLNYYGQGFLEIRQVEVTEYLPYRAARILGFLGIFLLIDLLWAFFSPLNPLHLKASTRYMVLGVAAITFFASLDFFGDFLIEGHDLIFHLNRIQSLAQAFLEGQIPQRIQTQVLNGYGYLSPIFYGELFLTLPAGLLLLGVPLLTAYQCFAVAVNLATAAVTAWCLYRVIPDWKKALFGSALYTLSTYRLLNVAVRSAVGEYTAMIFLPLILYGFYRVYSIPKDQPLGLKQALPIIIGLTGIIQSHLLTCEITALFILIALILFWRRTFCPRRFLVLAQAALLTLALNLWYLVPLLHSMVTMELNYQVGNLVSNIEFQSAYLLQIFSLFPTSVGGARGIGAMEEMPMGIGPALVILLGIFLAYCAARPHLGDKGKKPLGTAAVFFGFGGLAILLSSNLIPWQNLRHISDSLASVVGMVQFPSRYMGIAITFLVFGSVLILERLEKEFSPKPGLLLMGGLTIVCLIFAGKLTSEAADTMQWFTPYTLSKVEELQIGGGEEYAPAGTNTTPLEERLLIPGEGVESRELERQGTRSLWWCENASDADSWVDLPLLAYTNYHASDENGDPLPLTTGENNLLRVIIPGGYSGTITVEYCSPLLWRVCEGISLVSLAGLLIWAGLSSRKIRRLPPNP